jgi:hypothetical protein
LLSQVSVGLEVAATVDVVERWIDMLSASQLCYNYKWQVDRPELLQLSQHHSGYGTNKPGPPGCTADSPPLSVNSGFVTRVTGRQAGVTTLRVTVQCGVHDKRYRCF